MRMNIIWHFHLSDLGKWLFRNDMIQQYVDINQPTNEQINKQTNRDEHSVPKHKD